MKPDSLRGVRAWTGRTRDDDPPWLALVAEKVETLQYGVVQVVVHDGRVVQVERTERQRFDIRSVDAT